MPHPNRSIRNRSLASNPTPAEVQSARLAVRYTEAQAAATIYTTATIWAEWENPDSSRRRMHPAFFELFLLKTGQKTVDDILDEAAQRIAQSKDEPAGG